MNSLRLKCTFTGSQIPVKQRNQSDSKQGFRDEVFMIVLVPSFSFPGPLSHPRVTPGISMLGLNMILNGFPCCFSKKITG